MRVVISKALVLRKGFQIVSLVCLVGLSLLYPIIELLDRWDAPGPSSDSEIQIIVLLAFVGLVFLLGRRLASLAALVFAAIITDLWSRTDKPIHTLVFTLPTPLTASPPLPLRI